jgi:response regulator RpfG family c-di-GMP phosphodiesterase
VAAIDTAPPEGMGRCDQAGVASRLVEILTLRDEATGSHSRRVGRLAGMLAQTAGLERTEVEAIRLAAPLHDVGKLAIPDAVLLKPGPLDAAEDGLMRRHPQIGHDLLARTEMPLLGLAAEVALTHHERFDGEGYPHGLAGERIPLAGRMVAIVDSFDFLVATRPYHQAIPVEQALEALRAGRGRHFDPVFLDLFVAQMGTEGLADLRQTRPYRYAPREV